MISRRNLGPVLALTGAGIATAAVIAGFILVGGPGDARERRLDDMTMNRLANGIRIAQCAFNITGSVPASIEEAHAMRRAPTDPAGPGSLCGNGEPAETTRLRTGDKPVAAGDVSYQATGAANIRLCGNFRRPYRSDQRGHGWYNNMEGIYPQLSASRPAGIHCFDIELIKGNQLSLPSHEGHMTIIE